MSDTQTEDNPYANRNHESGTNALVKSDVHAVAALLGNVSGSLKEIDKQNVGSEGNNKALKINPTETLKNMFVSDSNNTETPSPVLNNSRETPKPQVTQKPAPVLQQQVSNVAVADEIEERLSKLEQRVFKKQFKFKRGIAYTINTVNIKGTFKDPDDIVDIVYSELAKQVKTITIKLDGTNKNTK